MSVPCCGRPTTENFNTSPGIGSAPVRVIRTYVPILVWMLLLLPPYVPILLWILLLPKPSTLNLVILAQLFSVLPLTVSLTNLAVTLVGKLYFSADRVVPLLLPVNTFVKLLPSF